TFTARDPERDYWHWKGLIAGHPTVGTASFDLDLPGLDSSSGDIAFVTVHLQGASESDVPREHRAVLSVGSEILGATVFDGLEAHTARFGVKTSTLEAALLATGKITVDVAAEVGSGSAQSLFYVDGFDVEYPRRYEAVGDVLEGDWNGHPRITVDGFGSAKVRVFDLLNPLRPKRIVDPTIEEAAPGRFLVGFRPSSGEGRFLAVGSGSVIEPEVVIDQPSDLLSRNQGADYLVITSGELMDAALRLADHRGASSGLSTQVVDIEDIMDEWSGGLYHPETVREFLGYATSSWRTSPRYVVLVGAGHFDYRDLQGFGGNPVPPLLVGTPFGLYASDSAFGDFDFDGSPEVLVSRIPALTAGEVVDYIAKLRAYESAGVPGFDAILVADNVDAGGDFTAQSEQILAFMPRLSKVERIYLDEQGLSGARARLLAAIDTGAPLVTYAGHGGVDRWAEEGLLQVGDVGGLTNLDSLGVFSSFSCNVARFELPGFTALAEALVLHPDGGSIAALAPSGLALGFESHDLNRLWVERFYGFQGGNLGDITLEVLRRFQGDAQYPYSAAVYNLIGDPLVLPRPLAE
ncbi:MAG: C25 family cysteine peptidase, partial [Acidobacteriota bacterium]